MADRLRLAVLISGSGSNLQAIVDRVAVGDLDCEIALVISNRADAYGLQRAAAAGIATRVIDHRSHNGRESFDAALREAIESAQIDRIVLAGFMRILTDGFCEHFRGRMINIHPSLLPEFKGLDTHRRAIEAGREYHGATVHFVTPTLDSGPLILRGRIRVLADDTPETLQQRVHRIEHRIYPQVVEWLCGDRLRLVGETVELDGEALPAGGAEIYDPEI